MNTTEIAKKSGKVRLEHHCFCGGTSNSTFGRANSIYKLVCRVAPANKKVGNVTSDGTFEIREYNRNGKIIKTGNHENIQEVLEQYFA